MTDIAQQALSHSPEPAVSIPTRPVTLRDVIKDCGGASVVASGIGVAAPSVYGWMSQGHLPLSELHGKTNYSDQLAAMQRSMRLSAVEIRRLGLRL